MEPQDSLKIIEQMFQESRKSIQRNSFHFFLWSALLIPAGILESILIGQPKIWLIWPVLAVVGWIITAIYSRKEERSAGVRSLGDRMMGYIWISYGIAIIPAIFISIYHHISPHLFIMTLSGLAVLTTGGVTKHRSFLVGGLTFCISAILCTLLLEPQFYGYAFSVTLLIGYVIPGYQLYKSESLEA